MTGNKVGIKSASREMNSTSIGTEAGQYNAHIRNAKFTKLRKRRETKMKNGGRGKLWRRYSAELRFLFK